MVTLHVTGMACDGCVKAVERVIKAQDPRASVKVDLGSGRSKPIRRPRPRRLSRRSRRRATARKRRDG
ncbi:MAG: heavy-metal-associated domain-containing protein [Rhodoplanes sp.]